MKRILLLLLMLVTTFGLGACDPNTTTDTATIPVTFINIEADIMEVCQTAIITLTVTVLPANATNQGYTISMQANNMLQFVSGSNNLQLEVINPDPSGEITPVIITVTSDYDSTLNNTLQIYVYPDGEVPPVCEMNS